MGNKLKNISVNSKILTVLNEFEDYCERHPRSPAAVRRPALTRRGRSYVALLGPNIETGIAGIGGTVRAALRAFDAQYFNALRPTS